MIKGFWADIIVSIYLIITLYLRFTAEEFLVNRPLISVLCGLVLLGFLWALIKVKFLAPDYFGLLKSAQE